ncbi:unnamed protein product [Cuscuta campestris]|uniref:F-box domain-containing protein n=1 Tax=Cuscuta campestris TaxID=132261 RepID=A0A484MF41_9ASTE|nr:unnamed protein product [Cuscuta campestris]
MVDQELSGLFPGLPEDLGLDCLIRVPYENLPAVTAVCRSWKLEIELPEFWRRRRVSGLSTRVVVFAQAQIDPTREPVPSAKHPATPRYGLTVFEPETGRWTRLPPVPGFSDGLPLFCEIVAVGTDLVLMGGWDPVTWEVSRVVFAYSFVRAAWRRGADMPGPRMSFFACASDGRRTAFVAGGHDEEKNALKSAMAYDVAGDRWAHLPDMARERDECKGVFVRGKFHVVGGYATAAQGQFGDDAETFDASAWRWEAPRGGFLGPATGCPRTCVGRGDGEWYTCGGGDVAKRTGTMTWQPVTQLPVAVHNVTCVMMWQDDKMLVIGSASHNEPHKAFVLDLKGYTWAAVAVPENFSGHVQSGCCLEI